MRRNVQFLAVGFGVLAVLAVIGVGKLISDHRKARLESAFGMLTVGLERLNRADPAGAQQQFQESVEAFRAVGRDPVLALHHAFAARLREQTADLREVRELAIPGSHKDDRLLAIALSEDSTLLAVTTKQRLLCLRLDNERWVDWKLPRPIETAGALHVDSTTGKAHVVVGDDGRLLTGNCRASGSPLVATASATENQRTVAWLDAGGLMAWVTPAHPEGAEVKIIARPLPGTKGEPIHMRVSFPGEANAIFGRAAVVHSIAKLDGNMLLFYGDANLAQNSDLRDESVLVISIAEPERQTNRVVFPASAVDEEGGKVRWHTTRVRRLLPASAPGRVYALTEGPQGVAVLGPDAKPIEVHADALTAAEYRDSREVYDLSVKSAEAEAVMEIRHRRTGARLRYDLPWRFRNRPRLAAISSEGHRVVVANVAGRILLIDVSKSLAP